MKRRCSAFILIAIAMTFPNVCAALNQTAEFAPAGGIIQPIESAHRAAICLNGSWQFQPVDVPKTFKRNTGTPPELPAASGKWDAVALKVPSPWNVNAWGTNKNASNAQQKYWPDSIFFPSYPARWTAAEMGWLRREFKVPGEWVDRRIVLHFEAVAGECEVLVNGKSAGSHFDSYLPFDLDVTDLVKRDGAANEIRVGVRSHRLFDLQSAKFPKMRAPYPTGSATEQLVGIWQDVYLIGVPELRVRDTFVQPYVDRNSLELQITLRNDTKSLQQANVGAVVRPWVNGGDPQGATPPAVGSTLSESVLTITPQMISVPAGGEQVIMLRQRVSEGQLKLWAPGSPALYTAVVSVEVGGKAVDASATRFGWRQFKIVGRDLTLNGRKIQLTGDLLHPFGPFVLSRNYAWAWYKVIQDFHGNSVRLHGQIHPRHFLELADEMGLIVLDETGLFGSSVAMNFEPQIAWDRFAEEYDGLVKRDRNYPSVLGWSFGNELFAIFNLNNVPQPQADEWYKKLAVLGNRARSLDPTRDWISCDGDEDLRGALPVYSKHFGLGLQADRLPDVDKPLMVGESGGTYYARPAQMAVFNGDVAYASYAGRNAALAIDAYDNIVNMARPKLAYYSASETAWFGIKHLNLGYTDFTRLPDLTDGVFFSAPFAEGKPGIQVERIPPFATTLNPGWDPSLPIYQPLAMFEAQKAALTPGGPAACEWDHKAPSAELNAAKPAPTIQNVTFIGKPASGLGRKLKSLGVTLDAHPSAGMTVVDLDSITNVDRPAIDRAIDGAKSSGSIVLVMTGKDRNAGDNLSAFLPVDATITDRPATALVNEKSDPWTAGFSLPQLYFAEEADRYIARQGLDGPFVASGQTLLTASNSDWSQFNNVPEVAKCAAAVLYETLQKPAGAVLVNSKIGSGHLAICTLDYTISGKPSTAMWRELLTNMGVQLGAASGTTIDAFDDDVLLNALAIGPIANSDVRDMKTQLGDTAEFPQADRVAGALKWKAIRAVNKDRFRLSDAGGPPAAGAGTTYLSYWINSPRATDELLAGGPDAPRVGTLCYATGTCAMLVNGVPLKPARDAAVDTRTLLVFDAIPLKKGWNHFLLRLDDEKKSEAPSVAIRLTSNSPPFLRQLDSTVEIPESQKP